MISSFLGAQRFAFVVAITLAGSIGCSKPQPPTITPKSAQVVAVGPTGVQLVVALDVSNPNDFPIVAQAVDGHLLLGAGDGIELGQAHAVPTSSIPAQGTSTVTSQLSVTWSSLAALAPFMLSPAAVPYHFNGTVTLGGEHLNLSLPFTLNGELTRAQLINAGLSGFAQPALR